MIRRPYQRGGACQSIRWYVAEAIYAALDLAALPYATRPDIVDALIEVGRPIGEIGRMATGETRDARPQRSPGVDVSRVRKHAIHRRARLIIQIAHQNHALA